MNQIKSIIVPVIASVIVVVIAFGTYHPKTTTIVREASPSQTLKGSSPETSSPYTVTNGITEWFYKTALSNVNAATTTPCIIQGPAATSSIAFASITLTTGTSTATTWTPIIGPNPTQYVGATTTFGVGGSSGSAQAFNLPSATLGSFVYNASSTMYTATTTVGGQIYNNGIIPPNWYFMWATGGIGNLTDTTKLNGVCQVQFIQLL